MPILGSYANSADPVQMPQNAASELGLHCLLTGISMQKHSKRKDIQHQNPKIRNGQIQIKRMDKSIGQNRVKDTDYGSLPKTLNTLNIRTPKIIAKYNFKMFPKISNRG